MSRQVVCTFPAIRIPRVAHPRLWILWYILESLCEGHWAVLMLHWTIAVFAAFYLPPKPMMGGRRKAAAVLGGLK